MNSFVNDEDQLYAAKQQCDIILNFSRTDNDSLYCSALFDGWSCWNDTDAGETAYIKCPSYITGFDPARIAHRVCEKDGSWFRRSDTNQTWSNYTSCVDVDDLQLRQRINKYYIIGYSLSVAALVISMAIFCFFKSLRCTRINIHKNLFFSFIVNNSSWITWYTTIDNHAIFRENKLSCQVFHVFLQYFMVCNYFWMFCEGFYLHTLLVMAFVNENEIMKWLYVIGWVVPAILTATYAGTRGLYSEETIHCWINDSQYLLILIVPVCISFAVNLLFLVNIVRVLITKMRAVNSPDINQTKKAVRATLILIPLLGLHYLVMLFRPDPGSPGEDIYQTISAIVISFQGLCVAFLFCFFNGEVLALINRKWNQTRFLRNRSYSVAATTTVSFDPRSKSSTCNGENESI